MELILDAEAAAVRRLIAAGKERGYVTVHELNATRTSGEAAQEMFEDTLAMLRDFRIAVVEDGPEDGEAAPKDPCGPLGPSPPQAGAEASLDPKQAEDDFGRTEGHDDAGRVMRPARPRVPSITRRARASSTAAATGWATS